MKKLLSILFVLSLILTSCGPDPVKYNDALVAYMDQANKDYNLANTQFNTAIEESNFGGINAITKAGIDSLNLRIEDIKKIEMPTDGKEFQEVSIAYIESLVEMVKAFEGYKVLADENATDEQFEMAYNALQAKEELSNKIFEKIDAVQRKFAAKNNFTIQ